MSSANLWFPRPFRQKQIPSSRGSVSNGSPPHETLSTVSYRLTGRQPGCRREAQYPANHFRGQWAGIELLWRALREDPKPR